MHPLLALALSMLVAPACLDPTQVTIVVRQDIACELTSEVTLDVGKIQTRTSACAPCASGDCFQRGTLVVTPSNGDRFVVAVATRLTGKDVSECARADLPADCIVARRRIGFIPRARLEMPILLSSRCAGVRCGPEQTCVNGGCVDSSIDPNDCVGKDCTNLPPPPDPLGIACGDVSALPKTAWPATGFCNTRTSSGFVAGPTTLTDVAWTYNNASGGCGAGILLGTPSVLELACTGPLVTLDPATGARIGETPSAAITGIAAGPDGSAYVTFGATSKFAACAYGVDAKERGCWGRIMDYVRGPTLTRGNVWASGSKGLYVFDLKAMGPPPSAIATAPSQPDGDMAVRPDGVIVIGSTNSFRGEVLSIDTSGAIARSPPLDSVISSVAVSPVNVTWVVSERGVVALDPGLQPMTIPLESERMVTARVAITPKAVVAAYGTKAGKGPAKVAWIDPFSRRVLDQVELGPDIAQPLNLVADKDGVLFVSVQRRDPNGGFGLGALCRVGADHKPVCIISEPASAPKTNLFHGIAITSLALAPGKLFIGSGGSYFVGALR